MRDIFTGTPSCLTPDVPGWSSSTTISRARTSSESSASSRSRTGSRQQSCCGRELAPLIAGALEEHALDLGVRLGARRLELLLDQVLAPDALAPRLEELRLERAERDPAVLARVRPVADEPAREVELAALRAPGRRRSSAPRPSRAMRARRRPSTRRRAAPRRSARARGARRAPRTRPSTRRRPGRRSGRRTGSAARPARRSGRAARSGRGSSCRGRSGRGRARPARSP